MRSWICLVPAVLALASPAQAGGLVGVPLTWSPTQTPTQLGVGSINLVPFQGRRIVLAPFTDARPDAEIIGRNTEKRDRPRLVTTNDKVPEWVAQQTRTFLSNLGLPMADAGGDRVITGEVVSFFVAEGENYLGDVRIRIQVLRDGKPVWSGMAIGAANHFGRSYKQANYMETLSDSLLEAWVSLLKSPDFLAALGS